MMWFFKRDTFKACVECQSFSSLKWSLSSEVTNFFNAADLTQIILLFCTEFFKYFSWYAGRITSSIGIKCRDSKCWFRFNRRFKEGRRRTESRGFRIRGRRRGEGRGQDCRSSQKNCMLSLKIDQQTVDQGQQTMLSPKVVQKTDRQ